MSPGELPSAAPERLPSRRAHLSPAEILRRSIETGRTRSMKGTETVIVQQPQGAMISMTRLVIHTRDGYTLTKWLDPPSQRGTVVLDDGTWSKRYQPSDGVTKISRSAAGVARARDAKSAATLLRLILRNYRLAYEGIAPMAGRICYKLRLTPIHGISNTVRMWIDRDTGAMLSHMESNGQGETLSVASFNGIEFPASLKGSDLRKSFPSRRSTNIGSGQNAELSFSRSQMLYDFGQVRKRVAFDFCPPYAMPGGYEFQYAEILSIKGVTTTCLRYSDGIADVTICQNRSADQRPAEYQSTQTLVDGGNNIVDYKVGQMNFYLVGRCQMGGLIAITNALSLQKERVYLGYLAQNYGLPLPKVAGLRNQGLGMDTLDAIFAISRQLIKSPKPLAQRLDSLVMLCKQGYGWTAIARRFGADSRALARIMNHVRTFECR